MIVLKARVASEREAEKRRDRPEQRDNGRSEREAAGNGPSIGRSERAGTGALVTVEVS